MENLRTLNNTPLGIKRKKLDNGGGK